MPSVLLEHCLDLGKAAAADDGDSAGSADALELFGQCSHADGGKATPLAGVDGISVGERLKTRHLQLTRLRRRMDTFSAPLTFR